MSYLYRLLTAHNTIPNHAIRKGFEETKEIIRRLEDTLEQLALSQNSGDTISILNLSGSVPQKEQSYPFFLNPGDLVPHVGKRLHRTRAVRVRWCELIFDPSVPASAATTFTLQNAASSPSSTGSITVASGASSAESSVLSVSVGIGQKLYLKCPSALNDLQNLYGFDVEFDLL